ncbi:hypothetical protein ACHAWT_002082 [Skeletonema menzelii]
MPFFYSQYLKDDKKAWAAREVSHIGKPGGGSPNNRSGSVFKKPSSSRSLSSTTPASSKKLTSRSSPLRQAPPTRSSPPSGKDVNNNNNNNNSTPSRLVWHSNVGSSLKPTTSKKGGGFFSAFQYNNPSKKKTVHFATIEVQPYNWDYSCDADVYYRKEQITAMNKQRFTDASQLRKERNIKVPPKKGDNSKTNTTSSTTTNSSSSSKPTAATNNKTKTKACDDTDIISKQADITQLLSEAFDPKRDLSEHISIRGIEHFVYPTLQQEMIQRKKHAKREVLQFQTSKRPDPQGWRLARLSEANTQWAREVAIEKGMRYCMNQEAIYGEEECGISKDELERSRDELDNLKMIKSSASCVDVPIETTLGNGDARSSSTEGITSMMVNVKMAYSEEEEESREVSQSAGADTRED